MASHAKDAAQDVAGTAREEARRVTGEATDQVRSLLTSARDEAFGHASTQQQKLAGHSRLVSDDLRRISRGEAPQSDLVSQLLSTVTTRVESFTTALETREPADLLRDARRFAARRPGAFLAAAAGLGLLAGRLTRGLSDGDDEHELDGRYRVPSAPGAYGPPPTPGARGDVSPESVGGLAPEFGEYPDTAVTPDAPGRAGTLPGGGFVAPDPTRDPLAGFERPGDRP